MLRSASLASALFVVLAAPATAAARDDGPYTPFPEGDPGPRAVKYIHRLNAERHQGHSTAAAHSPVAPKRLIEGTKLHDTGRTPAAEKALPRTETPSARAGVSGPGGGPRPAVLPFALAALVLAAAAIGFERRARRRPAHV